MLDEFNWGYVTTSQGDKIDELNAFLENRGRGGEVIAHFYHGIVVNLEKDSPENADWVIVILRYILQIVMLEI